MPDCLAEIFQVHLMANTGSWWHHAEFIKRLLAPAEKDVALMVSLHLQPDVLFKRVIIAKMVDSHRVVDNQINR